MGGKPGTGPWIRSNELWVEMSLKTLVNERGGVNGENRMGAFCAKCCSRCFSCMYPFNPHNNPMRWMLLFPPFYRWGNRVLNKLKVRKKEHMGGKSWDLSPGNPTPIGHHSCEIAMGLINCGHHVSVLWTEFVSPKINWSFNLWYLWIDLIWK